MMKPKYDFVIVGAGLFGASCARLLTDKGFKCLVIERNKTVGGMCATTRLNDIDVHLYGPHVLYTNNDAVWEFVNKYATFKDPNYSVLAMVGKKIYNLPINMNTFYKLYDVHFPVEVYEQIQNELEKYNLQHASNYEEQMIINAGYTAYMELIKPYTEKLWGIEAKLMPVEHSETLPVRYTYDNRYFPATYQGVPDEGYTTMIENILGDDIDILLGKDFLNDKDKYMQLGKMVIYSGPVDEFCSYIYGKLDWRTLNIKTSDESETSNNMFGSPVITVPDKNNNLLKIVEHKWLTPWRDTDKFKDSTVISYVYMDEWDPDKYAMYPVVTYDSLQKYNKYKEFLQNKYPNVLFGGRAGVYRPLNMSQTIELAMGLAEQINKQ